MEDLPAIWGSNPLQQLIAPLPINALTVVGHKTEGNTFHCQNTGKLKFEHETSKSLSSDICQNTSNLTMHDNCGSFQTILDNSRPS